MLSFVNKVSILAACSYWLRFIEDCFQRVIWSEEKWFVSQESPIKQIDWQIPGPWKLPRNCRMQEGPWSQSHGLGRKSEVYLEQVLKCSMWPAGKGSIQQASILTGSNEMVQAVTWQLHAFSSCLPGLGTEWFLGTQNIIGHRIHLACFLLTSSSGYKP